MRVFKNGIIIGIIYVLTIFLLDYVFGQDADDVIKKVQKKYKSAKDIIINFDREFVWGLAKKSDVIKGKMYLMGDDYMRYETSDQIFVTDGKYVWSHSAATNQTIIDSYKSDEDEVLPREMIFNFNKRYNSTLTGVEIIEGVNCYVLDAIPKKDELEVKSLKIWIDQKKWIAKRIRYVNLNDNFITYKILDMKFNNKLKKSLFTFKSPQGAEIVDLRTQ